MARAKGPALYELLKDGNKSKLSTPLPARGAAAVSSGAIGDRRWYASPPLALGIGALVLVVVVVAVLIGPGGGGSQGQPTDAGRSVPIDPLAARPVLVNPGPPAGVGGPQPVATTTVGLSAGHPQSGMTYLVVAHLGQAEAGQLVAFLAANGLEGFSVPGNNARLHLVMVLPAMTSRADWNGPAGRGLMDRVKSLGAQWKRANRGNSDFHDAYWDTY